MRRRSLAVGALALAAIAAAGASSAYAAGELGATVQSRVYVAEDPSLRVWNRSTVAAQFTFAAAEGWLVRPAELVLEPDEQAVVTIEGSGTDGASVTITVADVAPAPPGVQASRLEFEARLYLERPGSQLPIVLALVAAAIIVAGVGLAGALGWRRRRG